MKAQLIPICFAIGTLSAPLTALASNAEDTRERHQPNAHASAAEHRKPNWERWEHQRQDSLPCVSVPEPASIALLATGLVGIFLTRRRKI